MRTPPSVLIVWVPVTSGGAGSRGGMEGDSGIVIEDVCEDGIRNLGGRQV